jgi:hypothetical protein
LLAYKIIAARPMAMAPRPAAFATAAPLASAGALPVDEAAAPEAEVPDLELVMLAEAVMLAPDAAEERAVGRSEMVMPAEAQSFWTAGMISVGSH